MAGDEKPTTYNAMRHWVRDRACRAREEAGSRIGVWTEVGQEVVLIGIANEEASCVMEVERKDYRGLVVLGLIEEMGR